MLGSALGSPSTQKDTDVPLCVENLSIGYFNRDRSSFFEAVRELSFDVSSNELVSIVGPSGCGKSTVLGAIAGLTPYQRGAIHAGGKLVTEPGKDRAVVFQQAALLPWLTVQRNVAFGLRQRGTDKKTALDRAAEMLTLVNLARFAHSYPYQLSGGMQQRVNLARALATDPAILLLDEPFASLDAQHREMLQDELLRIWETTDKAGIFITHQIEEAILLADRVVVMSAGPSAVVRTVLEVDLPRPRHRDIVHEPKFGEYAREIREVLETDWSIDR